MVTSRRLAVLSSIFALMTAACSADTGSSTANTDGVPNVAEPSSSPSFVELTSADQYTPSRFDETSTTIDNPWFPMTPGMQLVYEGKSGLAGEERLDHRVIFTVTDLTKVIDGVRTVMLWEEDYTEGELVETELALFAQDTDGNVWHFGQYPEEYEDGALTKTPAWIAGVKGARTGITMKTEPKLGAPDYEQGFAPKPINWIDRAKVLEMGVRTCVPVDCYTNVLVTEEFELDKPGAAQLKYYAEGVGTVRVGWSGRNEDEHEVLVLTEANVLSADQLARIRREVLVIEGRAYETSPDVYGTTPPSEPLPS